MFEIMIEDSFASAHQLLGYEGLCENMHGHTWKVQVFLKGEKTDKIGMLYDFKKGKEILKDILSQFDHKNLNELQFFKDQNPTAENIAKIIFDLINVKIDNNVILDKITVWESEKTCATYHL